MILRVTTHGCQRGFPGTTETRSGRGHGAAEAVAVRKWRWPPQALAVAETRPRGPTGRVRAGLRSPGLPRDETRLSRLGRNPPSEPQSYVRTPESGSMVAYCDQKFGNG